MQEKLFFIEIKASEKLIKERVSIKRNDSDADYEVYKIIKDQFEEMKDEHLVLHSDEMELTNMVSKALQYLQNNK